MRLSLVNSLSHWQGKCVASDKLADVYGLPVNCSITMRMVALLCGCLLAVCTCCKPVFGSVTQPGSGLSSSVPIWGEAQHPFYRVGLGRGAAVGLHHDTSSCCDAIKMLTWHHCQFLPSVWAQFCQRWWETVTSNSPLHLGTLPSLPHWVWGEWEGQRRALLGSMVSVAHCAKPH